MNKICDTRIPQTDLLLSFRLFSNNGVSYFGPTEIECTFNSSMIDRIDQPVRILTDFLSKSGCRIASQFCGVNTDKDYLKELWNNVKREEKLIRGDGLNLKKINGDSFLFQDSSYRVFWPSFESFTQEYATSCKVGWFVFDVPLAMEQQRSIIKARPDILKARLQTIIVPNHERICISIDNGETSSIDEQWRRITESLVSILAISEKVEV